jgi:hypothetical protein
MSGHQECLQCGVCCEKWGWDQFGIIADLKPWITGGRDDILQHVSIRKKNHRRSTGAGLTLADLSEVELYHDYGLNCPACRDSAP